MAVWTWRFGVDRIAAAVIDFFSGLVEKRHFGPWTDGGVEFEEVWGTATRGRSVGGMSGLRRRTWRAWDVVRPRYRRRFAWPSTLVCYPLSTSS
jgi:hypothetical protein